MKKIINLFTILFVLKSYSAPICSEHEQNTPCITLQKVELTFDSFFMNGKSPNEKMALDALQQRILIDSSSRLTNY